MANILSAQAQALKQEAEKLGDEAFEKMCRMLGCCQPFNIQDKIAILSRYKRAYSTAS